MFFEKPFEQRRLRNCERFSANPGVKPSYARSMVEIESSFKQFITPEMLEAVVLHTNKYALSICPKFELTDVHELCRFIGCLIYCGVFKAKREYHKDMWSQDHGRSALKKCFSRDRFCNLMRFIRFDDVLDRHKSERRGRLDPIDQFFKHFIANSQSIYVSDFSLTIDEMMIPFRGRCIFKMYMPAKPCKYGIKIFALVEAKSKYLLNARIYCGKDDTGIDNTPTAIVMDLISKYLGKGYHLTTDNWYTSFPLAHQLLEKKTSFLGTIRKNKRELPLQFTERNGRGKGTNLYGYQKEMTLVSYIPDKKVFKNVLLISTLHTGKQNQAGLPNIIKDYNVMKCGVDVLDQLLGY